MTSARQTKLRSPPPVGVAVAVLLAFACTSCAPKYDDATDLLQAGTEKKIDAGLLRLASDRRVLDQARAGAVNAEESALVTKDASFAANIGFYADVESDLAVLQSRLQTQGDRSAARNGQAVGLIISAVTRVHDLHAKDGVPSVTYLDAARKAIDQPFQTLTLYQAQLRSGS